MTGVFIVLEGGDSVGKSTQLRWLTASLQQAGIAYLSTFEPGATWLGGHLRQLVLDTNSGDICPRAEALLYIADKAQHVTELILPALAAGKVVISDRYVDSTIAYQGGGRELSPEEVEQVARWATGNLRPDLTVLLDADPAEAVATLTSKDRLESASIELHRRARETFLSIAAADPAHYLVLAAHAPQEIIAAAVRKRLVTLGLYLSAPTTMPEQ
ncbi:MAG: dTMP kinase [Propionibacteriaceae bacterium]|jgi:dTMP kinase|nr:dTMP kinase [Propionibacteriaceae bacterium]